MNGNIGVNACGRTRHPQAGCAPNCRGRRPPTPKVRKWSPFARTLLSKRTAAGQATVTRVWGWRKLLLLGMQGLVFSEFDLRKSFTLPFGQIQGGWRDICLRRAFRPDVKEKTGFRRRSNDNKKETQTIADPGCNLDQIPQWRQEREEKSLAFVRASGRRRARSRRHRCRHGLDLEHLRLSVLSPL